MKTKNNKTAFTLVESMIVMVIMGVVAAAFFSAVRPTEIKQDAYIKSAGHLELQINIATKQIIAKRTPAGNLTRIRGVDNNYFSITDNGAGAKLISLYRNYLVGLRNVSVSDTYKNIELQDNTGAKINNVKISSFESGFILKNHAYFTLKLNQSCDSNETYVYDPAIITKRTASKSCGLIFYDVNGEKEPNVLGVDQYILSIGKIGIK